MAHRLWVTTDGLRLIAPPWNSTNSATSAPSPTPAPSPEPPKNATSRSPRSPSKSRSSNPNSAAASSIAAAAPAPFDRLARSVRLTDLGGAFLPRARSVLHELSSAKDELSERLQSESGPVVVGAIPTIAPYWLPSRLASFSRKFPKVHLTIAEEITPVLLDRLRAGSVDLAILALPVRGHEFDSHALFSERLFAALPKTHKLARRPSLQLADLRREPFLFLRY